MSTCTVCILDTDLLAGTMHLWKIWGIDLEMELIFGGGDWSSQPTRRDLCVQWCRVLPVILGDLCWNCNDSTMKCPVVKCLIESCHHAHLRGIVVNSNAFHGVDILPILHPQSAFSFIV